MRDDIILASQVPDCEDEDKDDEADKTVKSGRTVVVFGL